MAEWAQFKGGPPPPAGLERGRWYPIKRINNDKVLILGPNALSVALSSKLLRIIDREPDTVTRVQGTEFQPVSSPQPAPTMTFYGVCPEGHRIECLSLFATDANCEQCNRTYQVQDEERY
jgi:hypothetical protein